MAKDAGVKMFASSTTSFIITYSYDFNFDLSSSYLTHFFSQDANPYFRLILIQPPNKSYVIAVVTKSYTMSSIFMSSGQLCTMSSFKRRQR